jgi:hypothetical protein
LQNAGSDIGCGTRFLDQTPSSHGSVKAVKIPPNYTQRGSAASYFREVMRLCFPCSDGAENAFTLAFPDFSQSFKTDHFFIESPHCINACGRARIFQQVPGLGDLIYS